MSDVGVSALNKPSPKHLVICVDRVQFDLFFKHKFAESILISLRFIHSKPSVTTTQNAVTRTDVTAAKKAICLDYSEEF